jgi:3-methyladenine DNA glycosylase AlkD
MNVQAIRKRLRLLADREKAKVLQGFFKTGPGQYGEGDIFLGVTVPKLRGLAKECRDTAVDDIIKLLRSRVHEGRVLALLLLVRAYADGGDIIRRKIYTLYLRNTRFINNWDLVDLSAPNIVGHYLLDRGRRPLLELASSPDLWKRRIAILATFQFIKQNDFNDTLKISKQLLDDKHDLIHKAVGWMLREVGKRDQRTEEAFLRVHYRNMPRTMLRYAIERFPEAKRKKYLNSKI